MLQLDEGKGAHGERKQYLVQQRQAKEHSKLRTQIHQ